MSCFLLLAKNKTKLNKTQTLKHFTSDVWASALRQLFEWLPPDCPLQSPSFSRGRRCGCWNHIKIKPHLSLLSVLFSLFLWSSRILGIFFLSRRLNLVGSGMSGGSKILASSKNATNYSQYCCQVRRGDFSLSVRPGLGEGCCLLLTGRQGPHFSECDVYVFPPSPPFSLN